MELDATFRESNMTIDADFGESSMTEDADFGEVLVVNNGTIIKPSRIVDVLLSADSWVGSVSPYSQVVRIEGITEYSKVDLQPSVEQLGIFHNKDIAFLTENEDGVVTVFVIGDKPTMDYIIQATITEVKS